MRGLFSLGLRSPSLVTAGNGFSKLWWTLASALGFSLYVEFQASISSGDCKVPVFISFFLVTLVPL